MDSASPREEIIGVSDGDVDILFVDGESKTYLDEPLVSTVRDMSSLSRVVGYKDSDVWIRSVDQAIQALLHGVEGRKITVCGTDNMALKLVLSMMEKGSRLRLVVGCINSPDFGKNYNSGGIVAEETAKSARKATIRLYHDEKYKSVLELPAKE